MVERQMAEFSGVNSRSFCRGQLQLPGASTCWAELPCFSQRQGSDAFKPSFSWLTFRNAILCEGGKSMKKSWESWESWGPGLSHKLCCVMSPWGSGIDPNQYCKKILISIVFQYRVLIFQALKSIRKSIKKASKSQPKINTGTAAKMQVVFQIACLWSVGIGNYFVDSCLYMLYTCQNLSHNGPFVKDQWSHHFSFM